jgi:BirA family transcriptional regulator, biotin operon repressor / biotin---[acetyl-CoA-carboxylase] ligase
MERIELLSPTMSPGAAFRDSPQLAGELLKALRAGTTPPSELAAILGIEPIAVKRLADRLAAAGADIALHPILGYTLVHEPDALNTEAISSHIHDAWRPQIETVTSTASTNTDAFQRGSRDEAGPLVIFAEHQTAGRGRLGRSWESAPGEGLWLSFLLRPNSPLLIWHRITTLAALAVAESVESVAGVSAGIKWPNDVLVNDRKVAGILAETGTSPINGPFVVVGIGINVNQTEFPVEIAHTAGSLRQVSGRTVNRGELAGRLIDNFGRWLQALDENFPTAIHCASMRNTVLGKNITLHAGSTSFTGYAEALNADGELLLRLPDGKIKVFSAGEVTLRPR